jgi:hypothetical protein
MVILLQGTVPFLLPTLRRRSEKNNLSFATPARFLPIRKGLIPHLVDGPETAHEQGVPGREGS